MEPSLYSPAPFLARDCRPLASSTPLSNYRSQSGLSVLRAEEHGCVDGGRLFRSVASYSDGLHPVLSGRGEHSNQITLDLTVTYIL